MLAVGALLGFLGSRAMWKQQLKEERRKRRADLILRAVHLASSSLTYTRALLYSKMEGGTGVLGLPENPIDELMAITALHLREIIPDVQQLHEKQQQLFEHRTTGPGAADSMLGIAREFPSLVNRVNAKLEALAKANGRQPSL
jgi:hypothetical protein